MSKDSTHNRVSYNTPPPPPPPLFSVLLFVCLFARLFALLFVWWVLCFVLFVCCFHKLIISTLYLCGFNEYSYLKKSLENNAALSKPKPITAIKNNGYLEIGWSGFNSSDLPWRLPAPLSHDRLVGLVAKASASRAVDPGFESRLRRDIFSETSHTSDVKIGTPVAPGVIGSAPGLVCPASVYCDWVR